MRAVLAALCCGLFALLISSQAEAHSRQAVPTAAQIPAPGILHMLISGQRAIAKARQAHVQRRRVERARHPVRQVRRSAPASIEAALMPFEPGPASMFFGAGMQAVATAAATVDHVSRAIVRDVSEVTQKVTAAALAAGVPVNIALAVAKLESGFNPATRGAAGEVGVMQVLPRTAASIGCDAHEISCGMKYLAMAYRSSSNLCAAISGYNHGIGRPYCSSYGRKVLAMAGAS